MEDHNDHDDDEKDDHDDHDDDEMDDHDDEKMVIMMTMRWRIMMTMRSIPIKELPKYGSALGGQQDMRNKEEVTLT